MDPDLSAGLGVERRVVQHELGITALAGGSDDRAVGKTARDGGLGTYVPIPEALCTSSSRANEPQRIALGRLQ